METSKRYGLYHFRWQISAVIMMAPMYLFTAIIGMSSTLALIPCHFIGATGFWYIDQYIFEK